jgi:FlaA1/EpsC-like NDP-sugar epimerase
MATDSVHRRETTRLLPSQAQQRRRLLQLAWVGIDLLVLTVAAVLAAALLERPLLPEAWAMLGVMALVRVTAFVKLGMYRAVLRYSGIHVLGITVLGVLLGTAVGVLISWLGGNVATAKIGRAFIAIEALLAMAACGGLRFAARLVLEPRWSDGRERVLIYGAGDLGDATIRNLGRSGAFNPVAFLDDDPHLFGQSMHGRRVLGGLTDLPRIIQETRPAALFVAVHDLPDATARAIVRACQAAQVRVRVVRGIEHHSGGDQLSLANLRFEDLLPRPSRALDAAPVRTMLGGATVLVTGAGGSIGSELCRQICTAGATRLVLVDHSEYNLYQIEADLRRDHPQARIIPVLDDLQDGGRLRSLLSTHQPTAVFHAAAYKHVPMVEANPFRGVINNVGGFANVLAACHATGVGRLVLVSTDKAVRPTNVMGASKRVCELLLQNRPMGATRCAAVRFGNVLGSSGSVVPLFLEQIRRGGPVTVTHAEMTRYFMLIPEAVALVLASGAMAAHGEIFILDMGEPVKIADLARQLIYLSGGSETAVPITYTGLRPGEKLYEELLLGESERGTPVEGITVAKATAVPWGVLEEQTARLLQACRDEDLASFATVLRAIVPEWQPGEGLAGSSREFPMQAGT